MEQNTDKLIQEQFSKLPANLQQAIQAVPWKALLQEIGKENVLDAEQITSLEQETMFIIYGFEPPEEYVANIVRELAITEDAANVLAESVAEKIFEPILDKAEGSGADSVSTPAQAPSSVPEIAPEIHPAPVPGETAHDNPVGSTQQTVESIPAQMEVKPENSVDTPRPPATSYPDGKDPYREPLD